MSSMNSNQLFRRNGSPSISKQGPIRATKQFGLSSPSRVRPKSRSNADKSPVPRESAKTRARPLSETCILSEQERVSPSSPVPALKAVDKPRVSTRRSSSLENLMGPYLAGHWPKDGQWLKSESSSAVKEPATSTATTTTTTVSYTTTFTADKHTQTPEGWADQLDRRKAKSQSLPYKRAQSIGSGDQFKSIKHKLQRNGSHSSSSSSSYQPRLSPSLVPNASVTQPIKIPTSYSNQMAVPKGTPGKARASVEGLNQEVEKLIISGRVCDTDEPSSNVDGHRAPIVELLTRTTDTQTPSEPPQHVPDSSSLSYSRDPMPIMLEISEVMTEHSERSSSQSSEVSRSFSGTEDSDDRCLSVSPSFIPGQFDMEEVSTDPVKDPSLQRKLTVSSSTSPCPNSGFIREPPDGAERVKCMDETTSSAPIEVKHSMPVGNVHLLPSATSAFGLPSAARQTSIHNATASANPSISCSRLL